MADIEFPNWFATFTQAAQAGRQVAQQRQRQNALAMLGTDPVAAENALMQAGDFDSANALAQRRFVAQKQAAEQAALQRRQSVGEKAAKGDLTGARAEALQGGDLDLAAEIGKLDDQARARLEQNNAKVGGIAYQLLQVKDPQERQRLAAAAIPHLIEQGVLTQEQAAKVDLSDAGLQGYVGQAMQLKDIIEQANKDRDFGLKRADTEADNKRADAQLAETGRHNRVSEGTAAFSARDASARGWANVRTAQAAEARQSRAAPGGSAPKLTEAQAKDGFNASRMANAARRIGELEGAGFDAGRAQMVGGAPVGHVRDYQAAQNEWVDSLLRMTTGAAMTKDEVAHAKKTYFPQFGDSEAVRQQKARARAAVEQGAMRRAGPAGAQGQAAAPDPLGIR